nr:hypothetical protein [Actinoplanes sp. L3-i22]
MTLPRSGDVVLVGRAASIQFAQPILFRVIRAHDWQTYVGWIWLDGYEIDPAGDALRRRSIFVQLNGLQRAIRQGESGEEDKAQRNGRRRR